MLAPCRRSAWESATSAIPCHSNGKSLIIAMYKPTNVGSLINIWQWICARVRAPQWELGWLLRAKTTTPPPHHSTPPPTPAPAPPKVAAHPLPKVTALPLPGVTQCLRNPGTRYPKSRHTRYPMLSSVSEILAPTNQHLTQTNSQTLPSALPKSLCPEQPCSMSLLAQLP